MTLYQYLLLKYVLIPAMYIIAIVVVISWIVNWIYAGIMYLLSLPGIFLGWLLSLPMAFWDWLVQLVSFI